MRALKREQHQFKDHDDWGAMPFEKMSARIAQKAHNSCLSTIRHVVCMKIDTKINMRSKNKTE